MALLLSKKKYTVKLWDFDAEHIGALNTERENRRHLPGIAFPDTLLPTSNLQEAVAAVPTICMVVPSHGYRSVFQNLVSHLGNNTVIVSATKGIENATLQTMSQIMKDVLLRSKRKAKPELAVLSGPSFAKEVAEEVPTAITIGCRNETIAQELQKIFSTGYFRVYTSPDIIGLEVSAALKNIIAIAAGICDGLNFGMNARAALITRGLAEISRFGIKLGADPATFYGLSGMGDLVLTCTGDLSRNRTVGLKLGRGQKLDQILAEMAMVAEGVKNRKICVSFGQRKRDGNADTRAGLQDTLRK